MTEGDAEGGGLTEDEVYDAVRDALRDFLTKVVLGVLLLTALAGMLSRLSPDALSIDAVPVLAFLAVAFAVGFYGLRRI